MPLKPGETTKAVHDGMRVFEAWGSEVREFAMAFEVLEGKLSTSSSPIASILYFSTLMPR